MNSASPITWGWSRWRTRSAASSLAPDVSSSVAGTQEDNCTRRSIASPTELSRKYCSPSSPSTLQISCGSQIAVVVPRGRTQRSNSNGETSVLSQWTWVSMKPGTAILSRPSITVSPS